MGSLVPAHPLFRHSEGLGGAQRASRQVRRVPTRQALPGPWTLGGKRLASRGVRSWLGGIRKHFVACEREAW